MSAKIERFVIRHTSGSKINQVEEFDYSKPELSIGRAAGSDIQFDPEKEIIVSREHGKITKVSSDPPKFTITDNNSRNGIFVNKTRVKGTVDLNPGDEVQLGLNGPVFSFDIYPRPQDLMSATKVVEIPTSIKATTISAISPVTVVPNSEPVKVGLGKQTVERMLVAERKKSYSSMGIILGALVLVLGVLGYTFRNKLFGTTTIIKEKLAVDTAQLKKKSPDQIAKENTDKVVKIEFGWQLFDASTNDELWHAFTKLKGADGVERPVALYVQDAQGRYVPYLVEKRTDPYGIEVGIPAASGSGFVVSEDGFILTNRHVGAGWNTAWEFQSYEFPGLLVQADETGKLAITNKVVQRSDVGNWVPAEASMIGLRPVGQGTVIGKNTFMNVIFSGTAIRRPVTSSTPSDDHDIDLIKVDMPGSLSKVTMKDTYDHIAPGQSVTVMGYPGVAPEQYVVRKSNDPFHPNSEVTTVPTPTVTPGNIGRVIPGSSDKNLTYSSFGDSYQLTINATGPGNSGGPMFDDEGNVIGIYYAGTSGGGPQISFAVPIKYGIELMGPKKVN
jgi:serine protease Do